MSTTTPVRRFDFQDARRLPSGAARRLEQWHGETCALLSEGWSSMATAPVQVALGAVQSCRARAVLEQISATSLGVVLSIGSGQWSSLLVLEQPLLAALLSDLLGSDAADDCDVRALTPLQEALFDLLMHPLRGALADGWPGPRSLPCAVQDTVRPLRCRLLTQWDEVVAVRWKITNRLHSGDALWLAPRDALERLLAELDPVDAGHPVDESEQWSALASQLPLELSIELGSAAVSTEGLAALQPGDVLLLDQALQRPLIGRVAGEPVWLVAPCRVGGRQAVEIVSIRQA